MLTVVSVFAQTYMMSVARTDGTTDTYRITFRFCGLTKTLELNQADRPVADLLDIVFQEDGTAVDVSPLRHEVVSQPGSALTTYYNDIH